jgi:hypothetical protein
VDEPFSQGQLIPPLCLPGQVTCGAHERVFHFVVDVVLEEAERVDFPKVPGQVFANVVGPVWARNYAR